MNNLNLFLKKIMEWIGFVASILSILCFFGIDLKKIKVIIILIPIKLNNWADIIMKYICCKCENVKKLLSKLCRSNIKIILSISVKLKDYIYSSRKCFARKNEVVKRIFFKQQQNMIKINISTPYSLKIICYGILFAIILVYPIKTSNSEVLSVVACEKENQIQLSEEGIDLLVTAATSFPAERVTILASTDSQSYGPYYMHQGSEGWWFNANFYEKGTFTVLITAYTSDGQIATDSFEYTY